MRSVAHLSLCRIQDIARESHKSYPHCRQKPLIARLSSLRRRRSRRTNGQKQIAAQTETGSGNGTASCEKVTEIERSRDHRNRTAIKGIGREPWVIAKPSGNQR